MNERGFGGGPGTDPGTTSDNTRLLCTLLDLSRTDAMTSARTTKGATNERSRTKT